MGFPMGQQFANNSLYGPAVYLQGLPFQTQSRLVGAAIPKANQLGLHKGCQPIWGPMGSLYELPPDMWTNGFFTIPCKRQ